MLPEASSSATARHNIGRTSALQFAQPLTPDQALAYLDRLSLPVDTSAPAAPQLPPPTLETLTKLHILHVTKVPFENLSIHQPELRKVDLDERRGLKIDTAHVLNKIVKRRRGGYCFELNGLFASLLRTLGFVVRTGGARVTRRLPDPSGAHDIADLTVLAELRLSQKLVLGTLGGHIMLFVDIGPDTYLVDVGFGANGMLRPLPFLHNDKFVEPLPHSNPPLDAPGQHYRVRRGKYGSTAPPGPEDKELCYYSQVWVRKGPGAHGHWLDLYSFTTETCYAADYTARNYYASTHPDSAMAQEAIVALGTTDGGRLIIHEGRFKHRNALGVVTGSKPVGNDKERRTLLKHVFGIDW